MQHEENLALILTACLLAVPVALASVEETIDLSRLNDEQLVELLTQVQREIVAWRIERSQA